MDRLGFDTLASTYGLTTAINVAGESVWLSLPAPVPLADPATLLGTALGLGSAAAARLPAAGGTLTRFDLLRVVDGDDVASYHARVGLSWETTFTVDSALPLPALSNPSAMVLVSYRAGQVSWGIQLDGVLTFTAGGESVSVAVSLDLPAGLLQMTLAGGASLACLTSALGITPPVAVAGLRLAWANLSVNVRTGALGMALSLQDACTVPFDTGLGSGSFSVDTAEWSYRRSGAQASGWLAGSSRFTFNGAPFLVALRYAWGSDPGLSFSGTLAPGSAVRLSALCGGVELPAFLGAAAVSAATLAYDGAARRFTVSGTISDVVTVGGQGMDLTFTLVVDRSGPQPVTTMRAQVLVDGLRFEVAAGGSRAEPVLVAAYADATGHPVQLRRLIEAIQPGPLAASVPDGLQFQLRNAVLAFARVGATATTAARNKFLLAAEVAGGFALADLPLVGSRLPADQTVRAVFQPLVASDPFTEDELAAINRVVPPGGPLLPTTALSTRVSVQSTLYLGDRAVRLALPVGVSATGAINTVSTTAGGSAAGTPSVTPAAPVAPAVPAGRAATSSVEVAGVQWVPVQQAFGPVYLTRVGVACQAGQVSVYLGASVTAGGLTLSLDGLSVTTPLDTLRPTFGLLGVGIDFTRGTLEIGGALLRRPVAGAPQALAFDGVAVIRTPALSLNAMGSYTTDATGAPSLFLYASLDRALGGPAFFFVTGLAAGFGYNRALALPSLDGVAQFPLVRQAVAGAGTTPAPTLTDTLAALAPHIPPAPGRKFLAVGVKFTSFKLIESFALLTLSDGDGARLDLLGLSTAVIPTPLAGRPPVPPVAFVQMALRASFAPSQGVLRVEAQLTSASYLLSPDCHLGGGFAFVAWFTTGDFVLSLGGYHPAFRKPAHYPAVARLGVNWRVTAQVSIKGECYCALTPAAVMAGGRLQVLYEDGDSRAWFDASTDFLLSWKPYAYDIRMAVSVGASHTFHTLFTWTVSVDASADLHLWGPSFSGRAVVRVKGFQIEVAFGSGSAPTTGLSWGDFKASFLPADGQLLGVAVRGGRIGSPSAMTDLGMVNPSELRLEVSTLIPAKTAIVGGTAVPGAWSTDVGVYPMGLDAARFDTSRLVVQLSMFGTSVSAQFRVTPVLKPVPTGLWGSSSTNSPFAVTPPSLDAAPLVANTLAGFEITPARPLIAGAATSASLATLLDTPVTVPNAFAWEAVRDFQPTQPLSPAQRRAQLAATLASDQVRQARQALLATLGMDLPPGAGSAQELADSYLIAPVVGTFA
jgi:hypothetical protein